MNSKKKEEVKDKVIEEIFAGTEEIIKIALELEVSFNTEVVRVVHTKNKCYRFSVGLKPFKEIK